MSFVLSVLLDLLHFPRHGVAVAELVLQRGQLQREAKSRCVRPLFVQPGNPTLDLLAPGRIDGIGGAVGAGELCWAEASLHALAADHLGGRAPTLPRASS